MKKALVLAALMIGVAVLAKRFGPKMQDIDREKHFEQMPNNASPKWMFRNMVVSSGQCVSVR